MNVDPVNILTINPIYIDRHYISVKHRDLFVKQDKFYICRTCKQAISSGKQPKMNANNSLLCPWEEVPPHLLTMNEV